MLVLVWELQVCRGQAVLLVMEYPPSSGLLIVLRYTADALDSEIPIKYLDWYY